MADNAERAVADHGTEDAKHWGGVALTAVASAIPGVGPVLGPIVAGAVGYGAVVRARNVTDAAFEVIDPESLVERLKEDERLRDMFVLALDSSMRSSFEAKRAAMGRSVGTVGVDPKEIDKHELFVWALAQMEAIHIRLLSDAAQVTGGRREVMELAATYPSPVNATLLRVGAADSAARTTYNGDHPLAGPRPVPITITELTEFGLELLEWLREGPEREVDDA